MLQELNINVMFGVSEEKYDELAVLAGNRLEGKAKRTAVPQFIEELEKEERPLREKLIMATMLGLVITK